MCVCDCQWKMFCLVRLINQEKGESVSMHTVASHTAYREVCFLLFFFPMTQNVKCFIKYKKMRNITCFFSCFLITLIATDGVLKKGKRNFKKNLVLIEDTILTVQKSSTFHCLDPNCVRRCNNKSSGFYLFTNRI